VTVDLGQSLHLPCPQHKPNHGASYDWTNEDLIPFARDHRRAISPNGELFIMYITQKDIDDITSLRGIHCTITGANSIYQSGRFMFKKRSPGKTRLLLLFKEYLLNVIEYSLFEHADTLGPAQT